MNKTAALRGLSVDGHVKMVDWLPFPIPDEEMEESPAPSVVVDPPAWEMRNVGPVRRAVYGVAGMGILGLSAYTLVVFYGTTNEDDVLLPWIGALGVLAALVILWFVATGTQEKHSLPQISPALAPVDHPSRDDDLTYLMGMRWYFRYPIAAALIAGSIAVFPWITDHKPEWIAWLISGSGVLMALVIAKELGCLVLVLACFGIIWALGKWAESVAPVGAGAWFNKAALVAVGIYAWWWMDKAQRQLKDQESSIAWLRSDAKELNSRIDFLHEELRRRAPDPRWHD